MMMMPTMMHIMVMVAGILGGMVAGMLGMSKMMTYVLLIVLLLHTTPQLHTTQQYCSNTIVVVVAMALLGGSSAQPNRPRTYCLSLLPDGVTCIDGDEYAVRYRLERLDQVKEASAKVIMFKGGNFSDNRNLEGSLLSPHPSPPQKRMVTHSVVPRFSQTLTEPETTP